MSISDEEMKELDSKQRLRTAKILHICYLVAIAVYVVILVEWHRTGATAGFARDTVNLIAIFLGVVTVAEILIRPYIQKAAARKLKGPAGVFRVQIVSLSFCAAPAMYGLVLGIMGSSWAIVAPFLVVGAAALVLTFPTEQRWKKLMAGVQQ